MLIVYRSIHVIDMKAKLSTQEYAIYETAYDLFNKMLFENTLGDVLITLQRKPNTFGYYCKGAFNDLSSGGERAIDEIAVNPDIHALLPPIEVWQTLVHEMCHKWQEDHGTPSRRTYHNQEWSRKMESIGLIPSDTGEPGGRKVGQKMADYPAEKGLFIDAVKVLEEKGVALRTQSYVPKLIETLTTPAMSDEAIQEHVDEGYSEADAVRIATAINKRSKLKYKCPSCDVSAWGKPKIHLVCGDCRKDMIIA